MAVLQLVCSERMPFILPAYLIAIPAVDAHLQACCFYLIEDYVVNQTETWVVRAGLEESSITERYIASLYW